MLTFAPGSRIVVRNEEWLVRRVDPSSDGGYLLTCDGISDLVRGKTALFLTTLEGDKNITVLDPASTEFVTDVSSNYNSTCLYLEAKLKQSTPCDEKLHLGHRGVMNLTDYQLDPALQALKQPRQRILIADAVGLGKTLEAGILTTELMARGRGQRILVITLKSMLTQFQKEFWSRFSIPLIRLDSIGLQRVRNQIPSNHNPFNYYDRTIISIDTLKNNLEYRNYLENAWWDIIIIDECHNVAARARETGLSRRARLARLLSSRSDTLILLSATPHDGSARSFASLMSLLDPTAISDPDHYQKADFSDKGLVIRRFKKDIKDQVKQAFPERITQSLEVNASAKEIAAFEALLEVPFTQKGKCHPGKNQELQRIGLQKALFSSPAAALVSTQNRLRKLDRPEATEDEQQEICALQRFVETLEAIDVPSFSKFQRLMQELKSADYAWNQKDPSDRLVIFSERIESLRWLESVLPQVLKLDKKQFQILHGEMSDTEQQSIVERFGRKEDDMRILLCSDVASEGLNLHYFCHRLIHFDLPWSLMIFQQRNGRVDRFGQQAQPIITYLLTKLEIKPYKGDLRILEILMQKDQQAQTNLGDPASFLQAFDSEKEEERIIDTMAEHKSPEVFEQELDQNAEASVAPEASGLQNEANSLLLSFMNLATTAPVIEKPKVIEDMPTLFGESRSDGDYLYAKTALLELTRTDENARRFAQFDVDDQAKAITLTAPQDLQQRLKLQMPLEARNPEHRYVLTSSIDKMTNAMDQARQAKREEDTWPALHYLWPQHPIMEWITERVLTRFGRHRAPVIQSMKLQSGELAFILCSSIPNRKGQSVLIEWRVAIYHHGQWQLEAFESFIKRIGLEVGKLPNRGNELDTSELRKHLPEAVKLMRQFMIEKQTEFAHLSTERLKNNLVDLKRLQDSQEQYLQTEFGLSEEGNSRRQGDYERQAERVRKVFDEYRDWVQDTLTTEPEPFVQVLAGVVH